jgi:uncharacterized protein (DUF1697 family)
MPALRDILHDAGYANVRTVVASGNVVFERSKPSAPALERLIADELGVTTTVILRSAAQIKELRAAEPFPHDAYVAFLANKPRRLAAIDGLDAYAVVGPDLVIHFPDGYANARLTGAVIEQKLGVAATVRNWRTVLKLADLATSV